MIGTNNRWLQAVVAVFVLSGTAAVAADDMPVRKAGLWKQTHYEGKQTKEPESVVYQCVDEASEKAMREAGMNMSGVTCSEDVLQKKGDTLVGRSVCQIAGSQITTDYVISGNFNTRYRVESHSRNEPPLFGEAQSESVILAEWQGACKPGQKPGDMIIEEDGQTHTINLNDMRGLSGAQSQQGMEQLMQQLRDAQSQMGGAGVDLQDINKMMEQLQNLQQPPAR